MKITQNHAIYFSQRKNKIFNVLSPISVHHLIPKDLRINVSTYNMMSTLSSKSIRKTKRTHLERIELLHNYATCGDKRQKANAVKWLKILDKHQKACIMTIINFGD